MPITVAILGRPNVGKSTLFNRLCGLRIALVDPTPGVTRDRRSGNAALGDLRFEVIDTAGLDNAETGSIEASMQAQTERALADADVGLMLIDARAGVTPMDRHFTDWLRKSSIPIILVANKCEGKGTQSGLFEAFELGLGEPIAMSAEHGEGMADLYEVLAPFADRKTEEEDAASAEDGSEEAGADEEGSSGPLQLAIIGRPNVGKSTLLNRLLGDERVITGPEPGVTRDAISVSWEWQGQEIKLIDTAGLRRRARIQKKIEKLSAADTIRAIRFSNVAILVLDGTTMAERQDLTIADHVNHEGRALIIAVNKWDLVKDRKAAMKTLQDRLSISLPQLRGIPIVTLSAVTGEGIGKLIPAVLKSFKIWNTRLPTGPLNRWLDDVLEHHPPPLSRGRRLRLRYITQAKARPPTFAVFTSRPADIPESYRRYLVNSLRETFSLDGVPIRVNFRGGKNPYVSDKGKS
jgi:GTPase